MPCRRSVVGSDACKISVHTIPFKQVSVRRALDLIEWAVASSLQHRQAARGLGVESELNGGNMTLSRHGVVNLSTRATPHCVCQVLLRQVLDDSGCMWWGHF